MYQSHPSAEMSELFRAQPFQGARPERAEFVFVGLDANYAPDLESSPAFRRVVEYHEDGVAFWRRHGVHHPFLLAAYRGDGRRYHRNFARIGFTPEDASRVSFIELLHVPTTGRSRLTARDLDAGHLAALDALIRAGAPRHVFLSAGVARLMRRSGRFNWLPRILPSGEVLPVLHRHESTVVHLHLHFSNYGKFQERMDREALAIAQLAKPDGHPPGHATH